MPRCPRKIEVPRAAIHAFGLSLLAACSEGASPISSGGSDWDAVVCDLDLSFLVVGAAIDAIPSIDDPNLVSAKDEIPSYLDSDTRVIGFQIDGVAYAIPHNVLWFHEIVNLEVGGESLAVTYCPLTGSSLAFARGRVDNVTFGVSGLLYQNNLVLYDRNDPSSRWSQIFAEARCGPRSGTPLPQWPVVEMKWDAWVELHPETLVLSEDQGYGFDYRQNNYPYGFYEDLSVIPFWIPQAMPDLDLRRPTKERVLGVPPSFGFTPGTEDDPGFAFPFGELTGLTGSFQAVDFTYEGGPAIVLWSDDAQGGMAFRPRTEGGEMVSLVSTESGIEDLETGSVWSVDGRAMSGPLAGNRLGLPSSVPMLPSGVPGRPSIRKRTSGRDETDSETSGP